MGLSLANLFGAMPAGIAQGVLWGIMGLGVYITFRLLDMADMTVDGTFTTGGAVTVMLILNGWNPWAAVGIAFLAGIAAGAVTGLLHTKLGIPAILAGILTQFSLYSINLAIMGMKSNQAVSVDKYTLAVTSRSVSASLIIASAVVIVLIILLYLYFGTESGSAMRATGCNPTMAKAQGININRMKVIGVALANGIVAVSGGLMAQFQGFADINMGRGAIVIGLAAIIIGEAFANGLFAKHLNFAGKLGFVIFGGILYYITIVIVLWLRLNSNWLKMFTAIVVAVFLSVPYLQSYRKNSLSTAGRKAKKMKGE